MNFKTVENIFTEKLPYKFLIFACLLFGLSFILDNINNRFQQHDFRVFYMAAQAFLNNNQIYDVSFGLGSGWYKYSPFSLLLFAPAAMLPYKMVCIVNFLVITLSILISLLITRYLIVKFIIAQKVKFENLALSIILIFVLRHFIRELHMGNTNAILLLCLLLSLIFILNTKNIWGGLLLAIAIVTKPYLGLILFPLFLRKKIKPLFYTGVFIVIFIILPGIFTGFEKNISVHQDWFEIMINHHRTFVSHETIISILNYYFFIELASNAKYIVIGSVCLLFALFVLKNKKLENMHRDKALQEKSNTIFEWFLMIAIIPNLFNNDTQLFLISTPIIALFTYYMFMLKNYYLIGFYVVLLFMFGGNSLDLLGDPLSFILDEMGILGISNLIIITTTIVLFFRNQSNQKLIILNKFQ